MDMKKLAAEIVQRVGGKENIKMSPTVSPDCVLWSRTRKKWMWMGSRS